jgi:thiamine-monophosphate kinase
LTRGLPKYKREVIKGVGDDCAVLKMVENKHLLATCDVQVAGTHFFADIADPEDIGKKAIAVNVSDVAAMGGRPTHCLVSLIFPKKLDTEYIDALYRGIRGACSKSDVQIVGGNISSGQQLAIDIFMMGEVAPSNMLTRSGAKPGDKVLVTGSLGGSAAGLMVIKNNITLHQADGLQLIKKHLSPTPRLKEAEIIAKSHMATSMIDISDGLLSDIGHICDQSNVGVVINKSQLPVACGVLEVEEILELDSMSLVLSGGEDYELLFTAPSDLATGLAEKVKSQTGTEVTIIGEIIPALDGMWLAGDGDQIRPLSPSGWDHLSV